MHRFGHLAQRLFNVPLLVRPEKAELIIAALADRLGLAQIVVDAASPRILAAAPIIIGAEGTPQESTDRGYDVVQGVAIISIEGTLVHKLGTLRPYCGMMGYDGIRQAFYGALEDESVRAVAFIIDSPGGEASGCFDLADFIYAERGAKPIWAILDECAFSAAYAIASACDRVMVPRTGGTGSIGVVSMHVDWSRAIDNAGLKVTLMTFGARKADGRPELPLSKEARERFQQSVDRMGELFVQTVARNRSIPAQAVRDTEAAIYDGPEGVALGLADAVMAPDAAFRALLEELR